MQTGRLLDSMGRAHWTLAVLWLATALLPACSAGYLAGSGTVGATAPGTLSETRKALKQLYDRRTSNGQTSPTDKDSEEGEAVLDAVFRGARDPRLADIVVYLPSLDAPPLIYLMQDKQMVRVLNREGQIWVVTLAEKSGKECPTISLRLEGIGVAQIESTLSPNAAFEAMLNRKDMDQKALEPKEKLAETKVRKIDDLGNELCYDVQRFELAANSVNRLVVTPGAKEKPGKPQKVEVVNLPAWAISWPDAGLPDARTKEAAGTDDGAAEENGEAEREHPISYFNFANSRNPLHFGSIAIGFQPWGWGNGTRWCTEAGWCRPSIYAFGYPLTFPFGATWDLPQRLSISIPVVGVRLYDPALGDVVGGLRLGIEEGLSKALSRFGVIGGVSYVFTDRSAGSPDPNRVETRSTLGRWRLFTGVDFAF